MAILKFMVHNKIYLIIFYLAFVISNVNAENIVEINLIRYYSAPYGLLLIVSRLEYRLHTNPVYMNTH